MVWDDIIEREKRGKIVKTAAQAVGLGLGAVILQFFFQGEPEDAVIKESFAWLGLTLVIYGIVLLTIFLLRPHKLRFVYAIATYIVVPIPVVLYGAKIVQAILDKSN